MGSDWLANHRSLLLEPLQVRTDKAIRPCRCLSNPGMCRPPGLSSSSLTYEAAFSPQDPASYTHGLNHEDQRGQASPNGVDMHRANWGRSSQRRRYPRRVVGPSLADRAVPCREYYFACRILCLFAKCPTPGIQSCSMDSESPESSASEQRSSTV